MHLCANLSMLFTHAPMPDRLTLAAAAGFGSVEIQFPDPADESALLRARDAAGIPVTLINLPKGGADDVGLAALPGRRRDFAAALTEAVRQARTLEAAKVNILAGRPPPGADPADCRATLADNLRRAADALGDIGVRVMVEPVNPIDVPGFHLAGLDAGLEALSQADHPNLWLQFDLYHMAITEPDLGDAISRAGARIGHVQFADTPGRHEPGTGQIDFAAAIAALGAAGYDGALSAEYRPLGDTVQGLGWMSDFQRMLR